MIEISNTQRQKSYFLTSTLCNIHEPVLFRTKVYSTSLQPDGSETTTIKQKNHKMVSTADINYFNYFHCTPPNVKCLNLGFNRAESETGEEALTLVELNFIAPSMLCDSSPCKPVDYLPLVGLCPKTMTGRKRI